VRFWQWNEVIRKEHRRDFVLVLEERHRRLIGFTWGKPHDGAMRPTHPKCQTENCEERSLGELSKINSRCEYHGRRRMMTETAQRFLDRNIHSFILFAELSNPTLGFYDRMGGERLLRRSRAVQRRVRLA